MNADYDVLNYGESMRLILRGLYRKYGYTQYKMSKFEEYDLYARNKDFLVSDNIITFNDANGKLKALKPDVTLSIVRNSRDGADVQKVYYAENVYRMDKASHAFREIMQTGLECIGKIDVYQISEVLTLAAESLLRISSRSVLNLSHLDILSEMVNCLNLSEEYQQRVIKCIGSKNLHELTSICTEAGATLEQTEKLKGLLTTHGTAKQVIPKLEELGCAKEAVEQLRVLCENLTANGLGDLVCLDFSVVNDMNYYNGIVFNGLVEGVPQSVLSGGQYDRLMKKMGRHSGAIGFAVYLDSLERLNSEAPQFDVDLLLLYDENADSGDLCRAVKRLTGAGTTVMAQNNIPEKLKYRQLGKWNGSEVEILEIHA